MTIMEGFTERSTPGKALSDMSERDLRSEARACEPHRLVIPAQVRARLVDRIAVINAELARRSA